MNPLVERLASLISDVASSRDRTVVAIDGPDCAGKSSLAAALAHQLPGHVIRASIDSFHHPTTRRYERGELSPEGCYLDSFDYDRFRREVLTPFSTAGARGVLVVEGVFLLRPEFRDVWDVSVYLDVSPAETMRRARARDADALGADLERRYAERYLPAQDLYRAAADPTAHADVVIGYDDPGDPQIRRWPAWC